MSFFITIKKYKFHKHNFACRQIGLIVQGERFTVKCSLLLLLCAYICNPESQSVTKINK